MDCCSSKREPLGKGYVRGHHIPEGLGAAVPFGVAVHAKVSNPHSRLSCKSLQHCLMQCRPAHTTRMPHTTYTRMSLNSSHASHGWQSKLAHLPYDMKVTCLKVSVALHLCPSAYTLHSIAETVPFHVQMSNTFPQRQVISGSACRVGCPNPHSCCLTQFIDNKQAPAKAICLRPGPN